MEHRQRQGKTKSAWLGPDSLTSRNMSAQHKLDAVEEDAADLQHLKDWQMTSQSALPLCYLCGTPLKEPYIRCAECLGVQICPDCYSCGAEAKSHKNDHSFIVVRNDFPLVEGSSWTAREEVDLLDALLECGLGNWSDVSRRVKTHSAQACERHYMKNYVENRFIPELPQFREPAVEELRSAEPSLDLKLVECEDPPRYAANSSGARAMAGYNAARGDFEIEFDNHAEEDICDLNPHEFDEEDEYQELGRALQLGVLTRHNERLKERARRKKIVRDHGLILIRKTLTWLKKYDSSITRAVVERLFPFMKLLSDLDFTLLLEGLHHAGNLRLRLARLKSIREMGVTRLVSARLFQELESHRQEYIREKRLYTSNPAYCWQSIGETGVAIPSLPISPSPGPMRRPPRPLDIVGLPGYERLTQDERQLCSTVRIAPESYLTYRRLLTAEYKRSGALKLAQARVLIKIDVNKTRKLYDFLVEQGYIQPPP